MKSLLRIAASAGLLAVGAACAAGPSPSPETLRARIRPAPAPRVVVEGDWEKAPSPAELFNYFPERADRYGQGGVARLRCALDDAGYPRNCQVVSQDPQGFGFGPQAVLMMRNFKARPTGADGRPVGGSSIEFNVVFRAGDGPRRYP